MVVQGAIFDMDGVVVDNYPYHFMAWMAFAEKYKFPLNKEIYRDQFNGKTNADLFRQIFGNISVAQMNSYAEEKEGMYQQIYAPHMVAHKGLIEFLDFLRSKKIKIALGTSAPTANVDFTLDNLKLRKYFDAIVDGPQVTRGKPDPEVYQRCCSLLGIAPDAGVVFEDSLAGLESGKRAGCKIIGVATSHESWELKSHTDLILHDFTEAKRLLNL